MREVLASLIIQAVKQAQAQGEIPEFEVDDACLERPADTTHGDFSSTLALKSAKLSKLPPRVFAEKLITALPQTELIESVELAGPGFMNFKLSAQAQAAIFSEVRQKGRDFACNNFGNDQYVQLEFVSANPVGPMHMGHGRWAAFGDSLCRVMEYCGYRVQREFYINDAGSQMDVFARSISARYRQIAQLVTHQQLSVQQAADLLEVDRENFVSAEGASPLHAEFLASCGENSYGGEYIIRLAQEFYLQDKGAAAVLDEAEREAVFKELGYQAMMHNIRETLAEAGVFFDSYFSERSLHEPDTEGYTAITRAFKKLEDAGCLYRQDGALWFRSTDFGDDKDRVLVKSDGEYTYFAADIAYHSHKYDRGFDKVINLWGADHHGYIPRMMAATAALGHAGKLEVLLGQLVNLLRNGEPVRMSKRKGTMISFEELLNEVGKDAARYTLVSRSTDQEIDFDIELVKRQSSDNPVYYVQYAHARICSLIRRALIHYTGITEQVAEQMSESDLSEALAALISPQLSLDQPFDSSELELARLLAVFKENLPAVARDRAPHRLTHYAQDLASAFHHFYQRCQVISDDRALSYARLAICDACRIVLALNLELLGVHAPLKM